MAGSLKGRLSRLRGLGLEKASELVGREAEPGAGNRSASRKPAPAGTKRRSADRARPSFLDGWSRVGELAWSRVLRYEDRLPAAIDPVPFLPLSRVEAERSGPLRTTELRFLDLETTGLSGGTGTVAFLAAVGASDGYGFAVRQYFLEDYPGEGAFLDALLSALEPGAVVATYNGRSFDLPLLRTRCVMNGMAPPRRRDLDALFAARRLWRRVHGGASLGLLEREVLGREREEDIPGSMIPETWLSFLRTGDHPAMGAVLAHNAEDVVALAGLVARAAGIFAEPRAWAASSTVDRAGLGRSLLAAGRDEEGEELLEAALGDGDGDAGLVLARRYRRAGRIEDRRRILALLPLSFAGCVERAKFYERVDRDPGTALKWAVEARKLSAGRGQEEAIAARVARLRSKARGKSPRP